MFSSVFVSRPTGLRSSNVTLTSVRVDWNPVPERFILGYKVLVKNFPLNKTIHWYKNYAHITSLRSNTKYIISILPFHGLTDEEHPTGNAASIIVKTKKEPGKTIFIQGFESSQGRLVKVFYTICKDLEVLPLTQGVFTLLRILFDFVSTTQPVIQRVDIWARWPAKPAKPPFI